MRPTAEFGVRPIGNGPLIDASSHPSVGHNIQGPSLIRAPAWLPSSPGRYLLYFADHKGSRIRLAYADAIEGPWTIHPGGSLQLEESHFLTTPPNVSAEQATQLEEAYAKAIGPDGLMGEVLDDATTPHIASPDVHVDHDRRRIVMYFHGLERLAHQSTRMATSHDGIRFEARAQTLPRTYLRVFQVGNVTYGLAMPGVLYRFAGAIGDGLDVEVGPTMFEPAMRHSAVLVDPSHEYVDVFWTRVGDAPERIMCSRVATGDAWLDWSAGEPTEVLRPTMTWEGADQPAEPSKRGTAIGFLNQLRDPAVFVDEDRLVLLYAFGGESGIAAVELTHG